jgi:hypothetical protein
MWLNWGQAVKLGSSGDITILNDEIIIERNWDEKNKQLGWAFFKEKKKKKKEEEANTSITTEKSNIAMHWEETMKLKVTWECNQ